MTYLLMYFPSSKDPSAVVDCLTSSGILFKVHSSFEGLAPFAKDCPTFPERGGQEPIPWEGHIPGYPPLFHNEEKSFILMYFPPSSDPSTVVNCLTNYKILSKLDSTYEGLASFAKMCSIKVEIKEEEIDYSEGGDAVAMGNEPIPREIKEEIEEESGMTDDFNGQGAEETNKDVRRRSGRVPKPKKFYGDCEEVGQEVKNIVQKKRQKKEMGEASLERRRGRLSHFERQKGHQSDGEGSDGVKGGPEGRNQKPLPCDTSLNEDEEEQEGIDQTADDDDTESSNENKKMCPVDGCSEQFSSEEALRIHMRIHPKPMLCGVCQRAWPSAAALRAHHRIHSGEKPFSCPYCNGKFTQEGNLKRHIRQHPDEQPSECDICGKRFQNLASLTCHRRTHSEETMFACTMCSYRSPSSGNMTRHMLSHTGQKPFECSDCGKCFTQKQNMVIHKTAVHLGQKNFACTECDFKAARKWNLSIHMKRIHKK